MSSSFSSGGGGGGERPAAVTPTFCLQIHVAGCTPLRPVHMCKDQQPEWTSGGKSISSNDSLRESLISLDQSTQGRAGRRPEKTARKEPNRIKRANLSFLHDVHDDPTQWSLAVAARARGEKARTMVGSIWTQCEIGCLVAPLPRPRAPTSPPPASNAVRSSRPRRWAPEPRPLTQRASVLLALLSLS